MSKKYVMGNGAIALGALSAGVNLVSGYPGTPSSEIIETVSKFPHEGTYLEWSVNEKAAMEVAAAAAYSGARAMVTMKQVGLNVASDPLMRLSVGEGLAPPENLSVQGHPTAEHIKLSVGYGADTRVRHPVTFPMNAIQPRSKSIPPPPATFSWMG